MAFMGSPNEAAVKALLGQLIMSGMQPATDSQNMDIMRLQEQLMRSNRNIEDLDHRIREEERLSRERESAFRVDFDNSDRRGPHRSNFFGGALDRPEQNTPSELPWQQQGRWRSSSDSFCDDDRTDERRRSRERTSRFDDVGSERRGSGPVDMAASFGPGLPFPMSFQDLVSRAPNMLSDLANLQSYMAYGMDNKPLKPPYIVEPRPANQPQPSLSEKPLGCHTIFVGSLPDNITEDILREIFSQCGTIETVRISVGKGGKKFAHLRFIKAEAVDIAVGYSGYKLFVGEERSGGRLHIDYAKSREDEKEYEMMIRAKEREARHTKDNMEKPVLLFSESGASDLLQTIRSCSGSHESFNTVAQWLERGECTRKTSSTFYGLLSAVHTNIKRLVKDKKEHEEIVKKQRQEQEERAKRIMAQGSAIMKIFKAASKKKCWDHFSKAQRRNIDEWHQQVEKEIKISEEEQMEKREEVGMDLEEDHEESQTTSERSQQDTENTAEPEIKKQKLEDSEETDASQPETQTDQESQESKESQESQQLQESHEAQDLKLRAQSESLRALAEKNASLMWEVEGYKTEIVDLKQKFANVFQDKDLQIARLMTAVQGLQSFLQNVTLNAPEVNAANIKVEVIKDSSDVYDPSAPTTSEPTEQTTTETSEQSDEQRSQQKEEKPTDTEKQQEKSDEKKGKSEVKKGVRTRKRGRKKEKGVTEDMETSEQLSQDSQSTATETVDKSSVMKDGVTTTGVTKDSVTATTVSDDVTTSADATENASDPNSACQTGVIRLSSQDMTVVGLLCSYLQICPYGATSEQVLYHIQRQVPGVTVEDLEKVLDGLPMIFKGDGLEFLNKTWKFKQVLN